MRLKPRFAAPIILACSIVMLGWHLPVGKADQPPPSTPNHPITYANAYGHSTELVTAVQAQQRWNAVVTWNAVELWHSVEAENAAAEARRIEVDRVKLSAVASAGSHTPAEATPEPPPAIGSGDAEAAVRQYFGDIFDSAWGVSGCESGHNPGSISPGGGNYGLFQINYVHAAAFQRLTGKPYYNGALDAFANAKFARYLYDSSGGWGPWACRWAA